MPQLIEKETWDSGYYIDSNLLSEYGYLFPDYNRSYNIGIPLDRPYVSSRTISIDKKNKVHPSSRISWGHYSFDEKDMTPTGMIPVYQKIEQNFKNSLNEKLSKKREQLENYKNNLINKVKDEAILLYDLTNMYKTNYYKALHMYPEGKTYILKVKIDAIESSLLLRQWIGVLHNYLNHAVFYSSDENFVSLTYPCWVFLKAKFDRYDQYGDIKFVFDDAELICTE